MTYRPRTPLLAALLLAFWLTLLPAQPVAALSFDPFQETWMRADQPVRDGLVDRTWIWGPQANAYVTHEPYVESPDGERKVMYFDKSRMEITDPAADRGSLWYVTNGLLVVELVTGRMQLGDNTFEQREPAQVNVAGDVNDPDGPTYATFANLRAPYEGEQPTVITQTVDRIGNIGADERLATWHVGTSHWAPETGHWVATPFWDFMRSSGLIWTWNGNVSEPLFENPFYATGYPITEAYWTQVRVAGTPKDVLVQCFERRCLTYTPDNPPGWQVEMGNVGRHYYVWRYGEPPPKPVG